MKFTDRTIAALKSKKSRYEVWEPGQGAFGVRVSTKGRKSWVYLFRYEGKPRRMTLGHYPAMSLADAHMALAKAGDMAAAKMIFDRIVPVRRGVPASSLQRQRRRRRRSSARNGMLFA